MERVRSTSLIRRGAFDKEFFSRRVRIVGFGPNYRARHVDPEVQNWTFRDFTLANVQNRVDTSTTSVGRFLPEIAEILQVSDIMAPRPTDFNAVICSENDLSEHIEVQGPTHSVYLHRGAQADGIVLQPGQTYGVSAAGCPLLLIWSRMRNQVGVAHAGRRSLIDEHRFDFTIPRRTSESVVHSLVSKMSGYSREVIEDFRAMVVFPIPATLLRYEWFRDKDGILTEKGAFHKARSEYVMNRWGPDCTPGWQDSHRNLGLLDLDQLIRAQLVGLGVSPKRIKTVHLPKGWHTTRGAYPDHRNLYLVKFD